jgi:uncharacterized RDD family membrane protein YckC
MSSPARSLRTRAGVAPRLAAMAWDMPIIVAWGVVAAIVGFCMRELAGIRPSEPWQLDLEAFLTLVLPVVVTFAWLEASSARATPGKRRMGVIVATRGGGRPGIGRSLLRSAVKFTPWQMGHTAVFHLVAGSTALGFLILSLGAQAFSFASFLFMAFDREHRALHDWAAGTRVRRVEKG